MNPLYLRRVKGKPSPVAIVSTALKRVDREMVFC
jgi:hypothetical protein